MKSLMDKLQGIKLIGFKNINISNLCSVLSTFIKLTEFNSYSWIIKLKSCLFSSLFDEYEYVLSKSEDNRVLFAYVNRANRSDYINSFQNLVSCMKNRDVIYLKSLPQKKINLLKFIIYIPYMTCWTFKLIYKGLKLFEVFFVVYDLILIHELKRFIEHVDIRDYKLLTVYCDVWSDENYLVQHFKNANIKTATLQHGIFPKPFLEKCPNPVKEVLELKYMISDYMLLWNQLSKERAMLAGIDESKLFVLGIPAYANYIKKTMTFNHNKRFGVVLSVALYDEKNRKLIDIANKIGSDIGYKYVLKYHPSYNGTEYANLIDTNLCVGVCPRGMLISDYSKTVEFTLVGNSSVYIELIFLKHQVYRMVCNDGSDIYEGIMTNAFIDVEELGRLIREYDPEITQNLFINLCTTDNIKESYQNFFNQFDNTPRS